MFGIIPEMEIMSALHVLYLYCTVCLKDGKSYEQLKAELGDSTEIIKITMVSHLLDK